MKGFIDDMIHMTEGEKFVAYWPLWTLICLIPIACAGWYIYKQKKKG